MFCILSCLVIILRSIRFMCNLNLSIYRFMVSSLPFSALTQIKVNAGTFESSRLTLLQMSRSLTRLTHDATKKTVTSCINTEVCSSTNKQQSTAVKSIRMYRTVNKQGGQSTNTRTINSHRPVYEGARTFKRGKPNSCTLT